MKAVIQRVTHAECVIDVKEVGAIKNGFMILFGAGEGDTEADCDKLADKISKLRIFSDENDKTHLSIDDMAEICSSYRSSPFLRTAIRATARHLSMQASPMRRAGFMTISVLPAEAVSRAR